MSSSRRVFLFGPHPPTIGGIGIHVQRLASRLTETGWEAEVFDFYSGRDRRADPELPYRVWSGSPLQVLSQGISRCGSNPPALVHLHLSAGGKLIPLTLLATLIGLRTRILMTIHSGSFPAQVRQLSAFRRRCLGALLRRCQTIVAVSEAVGEAVREVHATADIKIIPPFLRPSNLTARSEHERPRRKPGVVIASGYGTPTYDWLTLLDACDGLDELSELRLVFYTEYAEPYFTQVRERLARFQGNAQVYRDIGQNRFLDLLDESSTFARPTRTDGDSLAVREALMLGIPVVASDAVQRPKGCRLFPTGNAMALRAALLDAFQDGANLPPLSADGGEALLAVIAAVAGTVPARQQVGSAPAQRNQRAAS